MELLEIEFLKELYSVILTLIILSFVLVFFGYIQEYKKQTFIKYLITFLFGIYIAYFIGNRNLLIGTDTLTYAYIYEYIYMPMQVFHSESDYLWDLFTFVLTRFSNDVTIQFVIVAYLYIFLPILGLKKYLHGNVLFFFLFFLISPNFFLYGANGIRNGLAASVFLYSFAFYGKRRQWFIILISCLIHLSMAGPAFFFFITKYFKNLKLVLTAWGFLLLLAVLNLNLLNFLPFSIDRLDNYLSGQNTDEVAMLFNIPVNFFIYSVSPIIVACYFIFKRKEYDDLYLRLVITYVMGSCLYILFFKANFAVRFAYISEFLMPVLMIYPFIKFRIIRFVELFLITLILLVFLTKAYKIFAS